jgi:tRNA (adenine37-N6)-methyltransferase
MENGPASDDSEMIPVKPIGVVHSPFRRASGTPIQPERANRAEGTVEVFKEYQEGLEDLEGFDRIWLICWFHSVCTPRLRVVPYLDDTERGLFATRAPSRPNPIGISPVRLLRVDKNILTVSDLDILDGTPLLDIKPYSPRFDCFERSRSGWLDQTGDRDRVADDRFEFFPPESNRR